MRHRKARLISRVGHLRHEAEPDWSLRQPPRDVFEPIVPRCVGGRYVTRGCRYRISSIL